MAQWPHTPSSASTWTTGIGEGQGEAGAGQPCNREGGSRLGRGWHQNHGVIGQGWGSSGRVTWGLSYCHPRNMSVTVVKTPMRGKSQVPTLQRGTQGEL